MKVAFCNRPTWDNPLGGDGVQMLETKKNLEQLYGVEIDIITDAALLSPDYDIVHIFNFSTVEITDTFVRRAVKLHIPVVSSSIYWDYSYSSTSIFRRFLGYPGHLTEARMKKELWILDFLAKTISRPSCMSSRFRKSIRSFIDESAMVLPNSEEESRLLLKFAGLSQDAMRKVRIVFNGVGTMEKRYNDLSEKEFLNKYGIPENYVLQVGRIEYAKNQLNLVHALRNDPDIPIVFVGRIFERQYFQKLKTISDRRGNVFFVDAVPHKDVALFYKYASVHVLLSLRESPGLVSLEAMQQGCPVVVADERFCPVHTYFIGNQYITNPFDAVQICENILAARNGGREKFFDLKRFSWENAAAQTFSSYQEVLASLSNQTPTAREMNFREKVVVIVVFYNPAEAQIGTFSELSQYYPVVAVDNSDSPLDWKFGSGFTYVPLCGNKGIAAAQNIGIRFARDLGAERCVFFDQDSRVSNHLVDDLTAEHDRIRALCKNVAAVGPIIVNADTGQAYQVRGKRMEGDYIVVRGLISSGSVINMDVLDSVGLMKEELFIDLVDTEWGFRAAREGLVCCMTERLRMNHCVGQVAKSFVGQEMLISSPARYYYRCRNAFILFGFDYIPVRVRCKVIARRIVELIYVPLVARTERRQILANMMQGMSDGMKYLFSRSRDKR